MCVCEREREKERERESVSSRERNPVLHVRGDKLSVCVDPRERGVVGFVCVRGVSV